MILVNKRPNFDSSIKDRICCPRARRVVAVWAVRAHIPSRAFFTSRPSARRTADCHNQAVSQGCRSSDPPRHARAPATQPPTETDLPTRQIAKLNFYLLESYSVWRLHLKVCKNWRNGSSMNSLNPLYVFILFSTFVYVLMAFDSLKDFYCKKINRH